MKAGKWIAVVLLAVMIPLPTSAAWVDDWLDQHTVTTPGYLSGQERGYLTGGGFSVRWHNTVDYPINIEMPRVKHGCGGIDMFFGGMSFGDKDWLQDKLERIMGGVAVAAFDLGLKVLCEQCANTIKNVEAMIDKLNSMQLDECAAGKTLVGIVADEDGFRSSDEMKEQLGTAIKENKITSGVNKFWHDLTDKEQAHNNEPQSGDVESVTSGCNADIANTFLSGGSLLENLGSDMSMPAGYTDLIRGLVGDVELSGPTEAYKVSYVAPCPQNNPDDIGAFTDGEVYARDAGGSCHQISDANRDLNEYVSTILQGILTKIKSKGALTTAERDFLDTNPLAALQILKTAVATQSEEPILGGLADISAKAYALQMLSDLYNRAEFLAAKARELLEKKATPASGQPAETCAAVIFASAADGGLSKMLDRIVRLQNSARDSYIASAKQMNSIFAYLQQMGNIQAQVKREVMRKYGSVVASRVAGQ